MNGNGVEYVSVQSKEEEEYGISSRRERRQTTASGLFEI